jgi:signal transduction histidine kinase
MTDKNRMKQVFNNLIKNAAEAMPQGGNLLIRSRFVANHIDTKISQAAAGSPGNVEITIRDDGPGIPDEIKPRLFEPYFTLKGEGHSGLGLSIVHNIVQQLKGSITCKSKNNEGTSFKVVFPIVPPHEV